MRFAQTHLRDVDQVFRWDENRNSKCLQLTPGRLDFTSRRAGVGRVGIEWISCKQALLVREAVQAPFFHVSIVFAASEPLIFRGHEFGRTAALICRPGEELEFRLPPDSQTLTVRASTGFSKTAGWNVTPMPVCELTEADLRNILAACREATETAKEREHDRVDGALQDGIVVAIRQGLNSAAECAKTKFRPFLLVKQAEQIMNEYEPAQKLRIADVAAETGASTRVLFEAFQKCLGVGPYEYHLIRRLHAFREAIIAGEMYHGKITQTAYSVGFNHLGRMTQMYRRHFCETPRQTMKRRRKCAALAESG